MSEPRTLVYVADHGLVKVRDDINIHMKGVVLASHPAVAKYPRAFRLLGSTDPAGVAYIKMFGDVAPLARVVDRITPLGIELASAPPAASLPRRSRPGRPAWDQALYLTRWDEATRRGQLSPHATVKEVAPYFELRNGLIGAEPPYLSRLDRRYRRDETPE